MAEEPVREEPDTPYFPPEPKVVDSPEYTEYLQGLIDILEDEGVFETEKPYYELRRIIETKNLNSKQKDIILDFVARNVGSIPEFKHIWATFSRLLFENQSFSDAQIDRIISNDIYMDEYYTLIEEQKKRLSPEQIDILLNKIKKWMTPEFMEKVEEWGREKGARVNIKSIYKHMVEKLVRHQNLNNEQVRHVLAYGEMANYVPSFQEMNQDNIKYYIKRCREQFDNCAGKEVGARISGDYCAGADFAFIQGIGKLFLNQGLDRDNNWRAIQLIEHMAKFKDKWQWLRHLRDAYPDIIPEVFVQYQKLSGEQVNHILGGPFGEYGLDYEALPMTVECIADECTPHFRAWAKNLHYLYSNQDITPKQIDGALEIGIGLKPLITEITEVEKGYEMKYPLSHDQITFIIKNRGSWRPVLYKSVRRFEEREIVGQDFHPEHVDLAIDKFKHLHVLLDQFKGGKPEVLVLSREQIFRIFGKILERSEGEEGELGIESEPMLVLSSLYRNYSVYFGDPERDYIFEYPELQTPHFYRYITLSEGRISRVLEQAKEEMARWEGQYNRDKWTDKWEDNFRGLIKGQQLSDEHVYTIMAFDNHLYDQGVKRFPFLSVDEKWMGTLDISDFLINHQDFSEEVLWWCLKTFIECSCYSALSSIIKVQTLASEQIGWLLDKALELGKERSGGILYRIYEYQDLTPEQIDRAIELGEHLDILFAYQTVSSEQIDQAIEKGVGLDVLYGNPNVTSEQRERILEKMGVEVPEGALESPLWGNLSPRKLPEALKIFQKARHERLDRIGKHRHYQLWMDKVETLRGTYKAKKTVIDVLREWLNEERSMYMKEGDISYAYYVDDDGNERKISIGKILTRADKKGMLKKWSKVKQFGEPQGELEIVISDDPEDIARKSTGQKWSSCETIGGSWGWPPQCGWCDDIKANNLIAYIRRMGREEWLGRAMIRWCMRGDVALDESLEDIEEKQIDAFIENYYGDPQYSSMLKDRVIEILRSHGLTGISGEVSCVTPYDYTGYVDSGSYVSGLKNIEYRIGDKPSMDNRGEGGPPPSSGGVLGGFIVMGVMIGAMWLAKKRLERKVILREVQ